MNDERFIALLNLYIDQQISSAEMQELEAELHANPKRQAVYRQYCQMHRAMMLVGEQFQRDPADADVAARIARVRQQTHRVPARSAWRYYAVGLAAACLAVFFVRFEIGKPILIQPMATSTVAASPVAVEQVMAIPVASAPAPKIADDRPVYISLKNLPVANAQDYAALLSALRREERLAAGEPPLDLVKEASLFNDRVFESPRYWQENRTRDFRSRTASPASQVEFTGFQFQR